MFMHKENINPICDLCCLMIDLMFTYVYDIYLTTLHTYKVGQTQYCLNVFNICTAKSPHNNTAWPMCCCTSQVNIFQFIFSLVYIDDACFKQMQSVCGFVQYLLNSKYSSQKSQYFYIYLPSFHRLWLNVCWWWQLNFDVYPGRFLFLPRPKADIAIRANLFGWT